MKTIKEALEIIEKNSKFTKTEIIPIELATNRVIAQDIFVKNDLPNFNTSAMDGYAILEDYEEICTVKYTILAGEQKNIDIEKNEVIKIMTGAKVNDDIFAIVPIENVEILEDDKIKLPEEIIKSANIRYKGEDLKKDTLIISQNHLLNASHLAILASSGITHIKVYKKLNIAILATGSEIKLHFEKLNDSQIYDTNSIYLLSRLKELNCNVTLLDKRVDNLDDIKNEITNNLSYDIIITTGGASVGDADFVKDAFNELNIEYFFNKVNIKPGKPISFGKIDNCYILNLAGNPFAMAITFEIFGKALIEQLQNQDNINISTIKAKLKIDIHNKKTTVIAGYFDGEYFDYIHNQGAGRVGILNNCNSYLIVDENIKEIKKDEIIDIVLYC
jgi:molybdopterin molybdotransferase